MFNINRQSGNRAHWLIPGLIMVLVSVTPGAVFADGWELTTAKEVVPGTREIESGEPEMAIRYSSEFLGRARGEEKFAALTNLCIGHLLLGEFAVARKYCEDAAAVPGNGTVAFNNRGVLNALEGDYSASVQDFSRAIESGCWMDCSAPETAPRDLPRPTARRNQARVEQIIADRQAQDKHEGITAKTE